MDEAAIDVEVQLYETPKEMCLHRPSISMAQNMNPFSHTYLNITRASL